MSGARKEAVRALCPDCGAEIWTTSTRGRTRCVACRRERQREWRKAYIERQKRDNPDEFRSRYNVNRNRWRATHREQDRESAKRRHERRMADPQKRESYLLYHKAYYQAHKADIAHAAKLRRQAKKGIVAAIMARKAARGELLECPRLHVKATSLPCGRRLECFGTVRCEKCPPSAARPSVKKLPWEACAVGW